MSTADATPRLRKTSSGAVAFGRMCLVTIAVSLQADDSGRRGEVGLA